METVSSLIDNRGLWNALGMFIWAVIFFVGGATFWHITTMRQANKTKHDTEQSKGGR